jgi:hypothetical protein
MASWLTCSLCGVIQEVAVDDPMPRDWRPTKDEQGILCPTCVKDSGLECVARDISAVLKETARGLEQLRKDRVVPPEIMAMPMDAPARALSPSAFEDVETVVGPPAPLDDENENR